MTAIQDLSPSLIEAGLVQPIIESFWREWLRSTSLSGYSQFLLDRMTLSAGTANDDMAPQLLAVGPQSFVATCFGANWAREATIRARTPDTRLEKLCARGYHVAMGGRPSLDVVKTITTDDDGQTMDLLYERLLVPIRTAGGHLVIGCVTAPLKPICWLPAPDAQDLSAGSSKDSRPREYDREP